MTRTPQWPYPKSALSLAPMAAKLDARTHRALEHYFNWAMERFKVQPATRAIAWVNATHDPVRALWCYKALKRLG